MDSFRCGAGSARGDQGRVAVPLPLQPWAYRASGIPLGTIKGVIDEVMY